jgi:phenylpropionate dioxygenase-like ring-hydroxylating dioxygenase large terminal subunit
LIVRSIREILVLFGGFMCPTPMAKAPEPALAYVPIPKQRYTSREFAQLEWERMWTRVWLLAGRASDAPEPGDYFTYEIGPESILVVRQRDGSLAARYNVCMHRGNRLREPGRGHASEFRCGFHGWQYDVDGSTTSTARCCARSTPSASGKACRPIG